MTESCLVGVVGPVGSGKSTSLFPEKELGIIGLNPKETVIINIAGKPFPFRGWRNIYVPFNGEKGGNYLVTEKAETIVMALDIISEKRPEIKNVVLEDFQYLMGFELMEKAMRKDWDKWNEIAMHCMMVLNKSRKLRPDIKVFVLAHSEDVVESGGFETTKKIKTVGRMVDEKIELPGLFTVLLYTKAKWDEPNKKTTYEFVTNRDGSYPAKSPFGMFKDLYIPNDLGFVVKCIDNYEK
jgi:hypothetical protein